MGDAEWSESVAWPEGVDRTSAVRIDYTNWRGERAWRRIIPYKIYFGVTEHHKFPQWILDAYDLDKYARRHFAMADIKAWIPLFGEESA